MLFIKDSVCHLNIRLYDNNHYGQKKWVFNSVQRFLLNREQAVSVNEGDYLGGLGRTVRLRDRLQGGERWVIVWRLCGCTSAGM